MKDVNESSVVHARRGEIIQGGLEKLYVIIHNATRNLTAVKSFWLEDETQINSLLVFLEEEAIYIPVLANGGLQTNLIPLVRMQESNGLTLKSDSSQCEVVLVMAHSPESVTKFVTRFMRYM